MNRTENNEYYNYINVNPKDKYGGDCVVRAIALALNQSWEQTVREMTELGIKHGLVLNDKKLYPKYLKLKGFREVKEPRDVNNRKITIREYLRYKFVLKAVVVNAGSHHVTCIKDNKVNDIWDCSKCTMHKYWIKGSNDND